MYQGKKNHATWVTSMTLDHEEGSYKYYREVAARCSQAAADVSQVKKGYWTEEKAAKYILADILKGDFYRDMVDEIVVKCRCGRRFLHSLTGLQRTLMMSTLESIDWDEVAEGFLEE